MKCTVVILVLVTLLLLQNLQLGACKRGRVSSSGSSRRSGSSLWGNNSNKKKSGSGNAQAKPVTNADLVVLSYPKQSGTVTKTKAVVPKIEPQKVQQKPVSTAQQNKPVASAPPADHGTANQKPIGWDVPKQQNAGLQQGSVQTKTVANQQQSAGGYGQGVPSAYSPQSQNPGQGSPPAYTASGHNSYGQGPPPAYTASGHNPYGQGPPPQYTLPGHNPYGQAPPAYTAGGYGQPGYGGHYQGQPAPNYGQQSFPGYHQSPNMGYNGQYPNQMGYGSHNYPNSGGGGGILGSFFGGKKQGYGSYGGGYGMGGFGGYGGMMGPKRSFGSGFASTAFTSIATGLLVWSLMRGGRSHYYNVYNHYNHPEAVPQEIELPANVITLCPENSTLLCAANTVPLCTANETILCAVSASATIPCQDNADASCVDTLPCTTDCEEGKENTTLTLPCIANATVSGQVNLQNSGSEAADMTMSLFKQTSSNPETVLCVTTMAMPSPQEEEAAKAMLANASTPEPILLGVNNATIETTALPIAK